jgi:hypothetical protein
MPKRIMIAGCIAGAGPGYAGNTWAFLQYILGLRRLGFDTYYVEEIAADKCVDEDGNLVCLSHSVNATQFSALLDQFDLLDHTALFAEKGSDCVGLSRAEVEKIAPDIDLLINLSGILRLDSILAKVRKRMYLDMDPGYTQIWQELGFDVYLGGHDVYVTTGLNLGQLDCPFSTCGIRWESTLPPVVLSEWVTDESPGFAYSTIADWRGFKPVQWHGVWYGQKADEFLRLIDLPHRVSVPLEICLLINPNEKARFELEHHGWRLVSPRHHASTPDAYRRYIFNSRGEFTVVKGGYAAGRTGWFSDRSACYLAAGRPVIVQDTGIGKYVPTGNGLLTFKDIDSAAEAIIHVESDYSRHASAAACFAREFLNSDRVLGRLLHLAGYEP